MPFFDDNPDKPCFVTGNKARLIDFSMTNARNNLFRICHNRANPLVRYPPTRHFKPGMIREGKIHLSPTPAHSKGCFFE